MTDKRDRAIVIGAGIAGVIVARALADHFAHVQVIERDPEVVPRPHVSQTPHTHILGAHGFRLLTRMFDRFDADLAAAGAPRFDFGECPYFGGRWAPRASLGLVSRSCTRPLFEKVLRLGLSRHANVELVTGQRAREPVLRGGRVTGVVYAQGREVEADLVVDAAGAGSKTSEWLVEHGYGEAPRTELDLHGSVVSLLFRPRPGRRNWIMLNVRRAGPQAPNWGVISHVEDGLWRVSMVGSAGARPPKDMPSYREFARNLASPVIAELLEGAEPVTEPGRFGNSRSHWIHYERMPRFPDGLVVVGDATFHPHYEHGQGMTFCAMAAELVGEHLDRHALGSATGSSLAFQRAMAARFAPWWDWNLSAELAVPGADAPPVTRAAEIRHRFFRRMRKAALGDAELWKTVLEVNQSVRHPRALLRPSVLWRVLDQRVRNRPLPREEIVDYEWLMQLGSESARSRDRAAVGGDPSE